MRHFHSILSRIRSAVHILQGLGVKAVISWVPSHFGIYWNEQVDEMAKAALQQIPDVGNNVITFAACKHIISKQITCTWQRCWDRSPTARTTYNYVPSVGKRIMFPARDSCWMSVHSEFTSIMLDSLIPKSANVVKEWMMHSIISSSVHDLVISVSHWCKLLIRHGPKPTVKDHLVVLLHCCLHQPISMYSQRISARTFWTLFLLSLNCLDVAFNILQIHENGQKT